MDFSFIPFSDPNPDPVDDLLAKKKNPIGANDIGASTHEASHSWCH